MHLLIAYIKNYRYGSGHFSRVLNIKKQISVKKILFFNIAEKKDRVSFLKHINKTNKKILLDISNKNFLKSQKKYLAKIQSIINKKNHKLIIIDDIKSNSALVYFNKCNIEFYINPYIKSLWRKKFIKNYFLGHKYLIGLNKYPKFNNKKNKIKNILIFLTGSKNTINLKFAKFIEQECNFFSNYKISFITANFLELKKKINLKFVKFYNILSVSNISKLLKKSDMVISGQGNFKYEIIITGHPLIIITEKKYHLLIKKRLSRLNVINIKNLKKIKKLILNSSSRSKNLTKIPLDNLFLNKIFS